MTQVEINTAISDAFQHLSELNEDLYDYYVKRLYTVDGDFVREEWNEKTLSQMEDDVMYNSECDSWEGGTQGVAFALCPWYITFVPEVSMNTQLLSVREQIQQDILTYASFIDDEKIFFNDEVLDELCEIVVRNFEKLN